MSCVEVSKLLKRTCRGTIDWHAKRSQHAKKFNPSFLPKIAVLVMDAYHWKSMLGFWCICICICVCWQHAAPNTYIKNLTSHLHAMIRTHNFISMLGFYLSVHIHWKPELHAVNRYTDTLNSTLGLSEISVPAIFFLSCQLSISHDPKTAIFAFKLCCWNLHA